MKKWMEFPLNGLGETLGWYIDRNIRGEERILLEGINPVYEAGKLGPALLLTEGTLSLRKKNESGSYIEEGFTIPRTAFSWSAWVKIDNADTTSTQDLLRIVFSNSKFVFQIVNFNSGLTASLTLYSGTSIGNYIELETKPLEREKWYHIAITYRLEENWYHAFTLYINGELVDWRRYGSNNRIPSINNASISMMTDIYGGDRSQRICNAIFSDECWTPQEVAMLAEPILAHYPLKYNHYITRAPNGKRESFSYFTDCKFRSDKRHINRGYESSSYEIVDMVNEGLTGRYLGSAKVLDIYDFESSYSDFFANLDHQERTVSFWFNVEIDYPEDTNGTIISLWSSDGIDFRIGQDSWYLQFNWSEGYDYKSYEVWSPSNDARRFNEKKSAATETFRLLTLTYDGTTMKVYIDGILEKSFSFSHPIDGYFSIGGHDFGSQNYTYASQLRFNDVRVYAKALSEEEIDYRGIEIDTKENMIIAGEFVETSYSAFHPKGVVFCKEIQESKSVTCPTLTTDGILKVNKIIER